MVTMSRDMGMGGEPDWQGNVAALRVAQLIASEIWTGQTARSVLAGRIRDGIDWVASIGFSQVHEPGPTAAICGFVNETIHQLQRLSKEDRAVQFPQAPADIDSWPLVTDVTQELAHSDLQVRYHEEATNRPRRSKKMFVILAHNSNNEVAVVGTPSGRPFASQAAADHAVLKLEAAHPSVSEQDAALLVVEIAPTNV